MSNLQTIRLFASVLLLWHQEGDQNRAADERRDDGEGPANREVTAEYLVEPDHFQAHEDEHESEAVFQEAEFVHDASEQEEHGAETKDGEDI